MKKIVYITESRASYGLMRTTLFAINKHLNLKLSIIVTGMHLSKRFGYTVNEIEKDGFHIAAKIDILSDKDTGAGTVEALGKLIIELSKLLEKIKPDIILLLGDTDEMLAGAIAGSHMNILVAHIAGGQVTGSIDEFIRHAITKLSHIHFTACENDAKRVMRMGEYSRNIFVVGAPRLDSAMNKKFIEKKILAKRYNIDLKNPILLVIQHPVTTEINQVEQQIKETMDAIVELKKQTIVVYPNSNAGGIKIINTLKKYKKYPFIQFHKNIPFDEFLSLMSITNVLIGNSSSGIIESPCFSLPVVNIGTRQQKRARSENVIDVGYNKEEIINAVNYALTNKKFMRIVKKAKSKYGSGNVDIKIAKVLSEIKITPDLLQKTLRY